jgi:dihydrodipicolinate synthase/N-acetylneuraminate lyase
MALWRRARLLQRKEAPSRYSSGSDENALSGLLAGLRGAPDVMVAVAPEGIVEMVRLGWLDQRRLRSPVALSDAVTLGRNSLH